MKYSKGQSGNPAGRPPGKPNKTTEEIRNLITEFLANNFDNINEDFNKLEPRDRLKFYIQLLQYGVPRLQNMNLTPINDEAQIKNRINLLFPPIVEIIEGVD